MRVSRLGDRHAPFYVEKHTVPISQYTDDFFVTRLVCEFPLFFLRSVSSHYELFMSVSFLKSYSVINEAQL